MAESLFRPKICFARFSVPVYTGSSSTGRNLNDAKMCFSPGRPKFDLAMRPTLMWSQYSWLPSRHPLVSAERQTPVLPKSSLVLVIHYFLVASIHVDKPFSTCSSLNLSPSSRAALRAIHIQSVSICGQNCFVLCGLVSAAQRK